MIDKPTGLLFRKQASPDCRDRNFVFRAAVGDYSLQALARCLKIATRFEGFSLQSANTSLPRYRPFPTQP